MSVEAQHPPEELAATDPSHSHSSTPTRDAPPSRTVVESIDVISSTAVTSTGDATPGAEPSTPKADSVSRPNPVVVDKPEAVSSTSLGETRQASAAVDDKSEELDDRSPTPLAAGRIAIAPASSASAPSPVVSSDGLGAPMPDAQSSKSAPLREDTETETVSVSGSEVQSVYSVANATSTHTLQSLGGSLSKASTASDDATSASTPATGKMSHRPNPVMSSSDDSGPYRVDFSGRIIPLSDAKARETYELSHAQREARKERDQARESKWLYMVPRWTDFCKRNPAKVKERIRKGIPDSLRALVWPSLTGSRVQMLNHKGLYQRLLKQESPYEAVIGRDINRTFPDHVLFRKDHDIHDVTMAQDHKEKAEESLGQGNLFRVCKAYSVYDKGTGYAQGMGFVAGLFLMYMGEEDAFWNLERLMMGEKYFLRGLYQEGFPLLQQYFWTLEQLMKTHCPKVVAHFAEQGIFPDLYGTQWFFTFYSYNFPPEVVLRIFDILLKEGVKILFRVALFILKSLQPLLLAGDFAETIGVLKRVHTHEMLQDADKFIASVLKVSLSRKEVHKLFNQYQAMQLQKKDGKAST